MPLENLDPKTDNKLKTVVNINDKIKDTKKLFREFIYLAQKASSAASNYASSLKLWMDSLQDLSMHYSDGIGDFLNQVSLMEANFAEMIENVAKCINDSIVETLPTQIDTEMKNLDATILFMKTQSRKLHSDLIKEEQKTKKSIKVGGQQALRQAMQNYNDLRNSIDLFKSDVTRRVFLVERHVFGAIMVSINEFLVQQNNIVHSLSLLEPQIEASNALKTTLDQLSEEQVKFVEPISDLKCIQLNTDNGNSEVFLTDTTNKIVLESAMHRMDNLSLSENEYSKFSPQMSQSLATSAPLPPTPPPPPSSSGAIHAPPLPQFDPQPPPITTAPPPSMTTAAPPLPPPPPPMPSKVYK